MLRIYFAAPLHDPEDQRRNAVWVADLRARGYLVYLPQEHGVWEELLPRFNNDEVAVRSFLYKQDLYAMAKADICVAAVDREKGPSEGMLWEMGWMVGNNKPVLLLNPGMKHRYNLMPQFGATMFETWPKLLDYLMEEDFC